MKARYIISAAISLLLLAGCASAPKTADTAVRVGMSRGELRLFFGEPVRVEPGAAGGETWYYRFSAWKTQPTGETGTREEFGERTDYVSVGMEFSKNIEERPIHVSPEGYVISPLPKGKVVKN